MTSLLSNRDKELELEIENFNTCWEQGQIAFQEGQKSAKNIFTLLKWKYGTLSSNKYILGKMMNKLGHLNGISNWKIRNLLRDDFD
jgi:hypothetical protein